MGSIRWLANHSAKPVPREELKKSLKSMGYVDKVLSGPYFYVAISKLKRKDQISVMNDGSVWKGTKQ